jgi:hypothetical protein
MQGLEGELDTCHTSFLHRVDDPSKLSPGLAESTANWGKDGMPQLTVHDTEYGYYYGSQRKLGGGQFNWRLTQWVLPSNSIIPHARFPISSRAYIPIDDENTFVFGTSFNPEQPLTEEDRDYLETGMGAAPKLIPGTFIPEVNRSNDYQRDFIAKRRGHATGIPGINNQDRALVEMMGPITDRSKEHLGTSDIAVIAARRRLLRMAKAMAQGDEPELPHHPTAFAVRPIDVTTDDETLNDVVERYRGKLRLP